MRRFIFLMLLAGASWAAVMLDPGVCTTDATSNETYCAQPPPAVSLTIWANDTQTVNNATITCLSSTVNVNTTYIYAPVSLTLWANDTQTVNNATVSCLGNLTMVENVTVVQNITVVNVTNVTQVVNYTCPAVSLNMVANSTQTVNNATITCTGTNTVITTNITTVQNQCNFSATIDPTSAAQVFTNVSGLNLVVNPIRNDYCYENKYETATDFRVWRSDRCNNTFMCQPPIQATCPTPTCTEKVCEECATCAAPVDCSPNITAAVEELNKTIYGNTGYLAQLSQRDGIINQYQTATNTIDTKIQTAVVKETGDIGLAYEWGLLAIIGLGGFWVFKSRQTPEPTRFGKAVTAETIADIKARVNKEVRDYGNKGDNAGSAGADPPAAQSP
jgi:hypothetical protein